MTSPVLTSIAWCMDEMERRRGWSWSSCPPPQSVSAGQTPPSPKMTPDSLLVWRRWQDPKIIVQLSIGNFCWNQRRLEYLKIMNSYFWQFLINLAHLFIFCSKGNCWFLFNNIQFMHWPCHDFCAFVCLPVVKSEMTWVGVLCEQAIVNALQ